MKTNERAEIIECVRAMHVYVCVSMCAFSRKRPVLRQKIDLTQFVPSAAFQTYEPVTKTEKLHIRIIIKNTISSSDSSEESSSKESKFSNTMQNSIVIQRISYISVFVRNALHQQRTTLFFVRWVQLIRISKWF